MSTSDFPSCSSTAKVSSAVSCSNAKPAAIVFERYGTTTRLEAQRAAVNTRRRFPAPTADLSRRWCSGHLKIDVCARAVTNDLTLQGTRVRPRRLVVVSGERREESAARSRYAEWERHRTFSQSRHVWQWRPVVGWSESEVWVIIRRWGILPHPSYLLGWRCGEEDGRVAHWEVGIIAVQPLGPSTCRVEAATFSSPHCRPPTGGVPSS